MEGQLLATARPYLEVFSLFSLTPPPSSYGRSIPSTKWKHLMSIFSCYVGCVFLLSIYVCFVNIAILDVEVKELAVEDFTNALGIVQKVFYILILGTNAVFMLIYYKKLGGIYTEISTLELEIEAIFQTVSSQRKCTKCRMYLFKRIGLWAIFLMISIPRSTLATLTDYMAWKDKILTEFIMIVLQFKIIEYTLFVILIQKLLLRLRQKLLRLQQELRACDRSSSVLQALCQALRKNKHMLSRIWKLVDELETYFWLPMLLIFLYNGICILHMVNWAFILAWSPSDCCRFWRPAHLLILLFNLLIPCWFSRSCIDTYNSFGRILHNIHCSCGLNVPPLLKTILMEYSLQFEHLKLRFSCGSFFDINLEYFAGMVVSIISYIVFLIQFKLQAGLEATLAAKRHNILKKLNVSSKLNR